MREILMRLAALFMLIFLNVACDKLMPVRIIQVNTCPTIVGTISEPNRIWLGVREEYLILENGEKMRKEDVLIDAFGHSCELIYREGK